MVKKLLIVMCLIFCPATLVLASKSPPAAIYIIVDTSWSCEQEMQDFRSLARQAVVTLSPGDYMEILSAHPKQPKIRLAQNIKTASTSEFKEIQSTLFSIKSHFLTDASLSKAVAFCINRIKRTEQEFGPKVLFVFTDGILNPGDMKYFETLYSKLKSEDIYLYITGRDKTTRKILFAANQKKICYSLLKEANPAQWLTSIRKNQNTQETVLPIINELSLNQTTPLIKPEDHEKEPKTDVEIQHRSEVQVKVNKETPINDTILQSETEILSEPIKKESPLEITEPEPIGDFEEPPLPEPKEQPDKQKWGKTWFFSPWLLLIPPALLFVLASLFVLNNFRNAREWASKIKARTKKRTRKAPDRVIIKIGDRIQQLGTFDRISKVHIGSSSKNTIRIHDSTVSDQHLRLSRKKDTLWVKNLSPKPVSINSIPLERGKSTRIPLPSIFKLSDSVTIKIELQKKPSIPLPSQEVSNG